MISIIGKKFDLNNKTIALNIFCVPYNTEKVRLAYKSKHNFMRENQVSLLIITDGKEWPYLAVKVLSASHQITMETFIV